MLFPKRQDYLDADSKNLALGGNAKFKIPRVWPIDSMILEVDFALTHAGAPTMLADGFMNLAKRITLNGPDGIRNRSVVDISGISLIELAYHYTGFMHRDNRKVVNTLAGGIGQTPTSGATYKLRYPIFFAMPQLDDPVSSLFLLPVDRYNADPVLSVDFAAASDLYTGGTTPTVAISDVKLLLVQREITRKGFRTFDTELFEQEVTHAAAGDNLQTEIPVAGSYTGILMRTYLNAIRADNSGAKAWELKLAGNIFRRFRLQDLESENDLSACGGIADGDCLPASYYLDFITDRPGPGGSDFEAALGSLLNANIPLNTGAKIYIKQNVPTITGTTKTVFAMHRVYGDMSEFKP